MSSVHSAHGLRDTPSSGDPSGRGSVDAAAGLHVAQDLSTGQFAVEGFGHRATLRPWTWGERRRLLEACTRRGGLDEAALIATLCRLVYAPAPPEVLAPLFACVALDRLGARPGRAVLPLDDAELLLAREIGWGPRELDDQPACDVDRLVDRLVRARGGPALPGHPPPGDDEWTVIRIDDPEDG